MPPETTTRPRVDGWARLSGAILPVTIVGAILVFVVPLPPGVLDLLLAGNITLAVLVLLTVLAIRTPQDFSAFPTVLLATTLTRLVLNVASTRLILTRGGVEGLDGAGGVIRAFGEFVAGDKLVVGAVLFLILVVIQFVVITKGATRISEVAARFMLDGLPGRQMAIDADLHAGLIDQKVASRRREEIYRQADFFGAMDGAGKFVRGDAIAGVIITFVNILGGLYMGVVDQGMSVGEAVGVFSKLTIGDGLVSQVPAFLISLAAGLIVTRSSSDSDLGRDVTGQLFGRAEVLGAAAVFLGVLAFTALPKLPLLTLAGALGAGAYVLSTRPEGAGESVEDEAESAATAVDAPAAPPSPAAGASHEAPSERIDDLLQVDPLELEIGYRLIGLAEPTRGGDLLERIRGVRQRVARELGLIIPQVRIRDEMALGPNEYRFKIRGAAVGQGAAYSGKLLAIPPAGLVQRPEGRDGIDPVSGQPAVWIHADGREVAELAGCRVVEASAVVAGHFGEIILGHADELMTHEQVRRLLDRARASAPGLVDEVVPHLLRPGEVRRVLQNLVRERVSIRDMEAILEALAEHAGKTRDVGLLTEHVRRALGRQITQPYREADGRLRAVTLSRTLDAKLAAAGRLDETGPSAALGAEATRGLVRAVAAALGPLVEAGHPPVVIASSEARPVLKDLTRADLPRLVVLGQREIPRDTPVETLGTVVEEDHPVVSSVSTVVGVH
jgi:flagellar biosynthesis protein FlhA